MMILKAGDMENMINGTTPYFDFHDEGLTKSHIPNNTGDVFQISSVKKNNSVINSSVLFSLGFLSNALALLVLKRSPSDQKRKLFYRLVAGLTVTDLIGTTATSPVVIAVYVNDFRWIGGNPLCKYFGFMMIFSGVATTTIVCIMAIERLICIRHPYLYYAQLRKKHATLFLFGAWIFAGLIASLPLMGFGEIVLQYPYTWCFFDYYTENLGHRGFNCLFAILALLTISVTVTCNGIVLYTLFQTKMRGISRQNSRDSRTFSGYSRRYAECQMAVLLIGITVVFSSCYLPLMIRILINQTKLLPVNLRTDLLMIRLASLNQVLDPWVYILLRREVVWKVASTLKKLFSRQSKGSEINKFRRDSDINKFRRQDSSAVLMNDVQYTCCVFCWHCLCDPPQPQRPCGSFYSDYGRNSIYSAPGSPTNKLVLHVMNSVMIPESSDDNSSKSDRRSQVISELKRQASMDAEPVSQQPTKQTRVQMYCNGSSSHDGLESQICNTLVECEEYQDISDVDSV